MKSPLAIEIIESQFIILIQRCETISLFSVLILTPCPKQVLKLLELFSVPTEGELLCEVTEFTANENVLLCGAGTN